MIYGATDFYDGCKTFNRTDISIFNESKVSDSSGATHHQKLMHLLLAQKSVPQPSSATLNSTHKAHAHNTRPPEIRYQP